MTDKVNAIILAGTHADKTKLIYGENKALLKINEKPIILNVLQALQNSDYINQDKIAVVGPKELEKIIQDVPIMNESLAPKESRRFIENAINNYNILSPNGERTLFVPSDIPLISSKTIGDFVSKCNNYDASLYLALINIKNIPAEIEQLKKSAGFYLRNKGHFRTANLILYESSKIKNREFLESEIEKAFPIRRTTSKFSKIHLYWFLAKSYPIEILKYMTNNLKEEEIENAFKRKPGISFKFIEITDPRTAIEIDYEDEFTFLNNPENYKRLEKICNEMHN